MMNILTKYRQDNNVTLEALGDAVGGVNKSTVLRWEEGKVPVDRLADVERVTGIPRAQLRPDIFGATA
jgi:transcriptional regulator with XRE-family HTH domain